MGAVEIASALAAARRAVRLYPPEHPTHREALGELVTTVNQSVDIRPLVLNLREGRLYEASQIIQDTSPATRALAEAMESRRVESMTFHMGFTEIDGEGISQVLGMRPSPELVVSTELEALGVKAVTVSELEDNSAKQAEERDRQREADRVLLRRMLTALERARAALIEGEATDPSDLVRTLAPFVERVTQAPDAILALAQMTGHGDRWRFHATGVALYAMVLGRAMGLSDTQLVEIGACGLLHDIGLTLASDEVDDEAARFAHPWTGARAIAPLADENLAAMVVTYEHHMGVDGSGWPERQPGYLSHPYSRIVAVCDRYDELLRPAEGLGMRPDQAVAQLLQEASGGPLDPFAARLFAGAVSVLPIGCVVRLSDFSVAVVSSAGSDPMRPHTRLVIGSDGTELRPVRDLDIAESDLHIVEVLPGELLGLQASDYL